MRSRITSDEEVLCLGDFRYDLRQLNRVIVVAVGKAASPMVEGLLPALRGALRRDQTFQAIVVGPDPAGPQDARVQALHGSHPFPDEHARLAADSILRLLSTADERTLVLFMVSGGASAMVEEPIRSSITQRDVVAFHQALVHSGLPIHTINPLRKHLSRVKGGRLAVAAQHSLQCTVLVSDVPGDLFHLVGSGPSLPDPSTTEECRQTLRLHSEMLKLPASVEDYFRSESVEETPKEDHPAFRNSQWFVLLSSDDLVQAAQRIASSEGFHVVIDNHCDDWDYRAAAEYLLHRLEQLRREHGRVCLLSGGEVTVQVPAQHGAGGRNQQFTLECCRLLAEQGTNATVLSGGSDGIDGNSLAAGAVGDQTTFPRAAQKGIDAAAALRHFDSFAVFQALDDAIVTGPTGNNLRDLRLLLSGD